MAKNNGRGLFLVSISEGKNPGKNRHLFFLREVSSWTSSILILVMLPIIVRHLLFKLSWRMSVRDLMWSLTYHVPSSDCARTGLRDDRECFSWWLRCCVGTAALVACWLTFSHENSWCQNLLAKSAFHLFQQLDKKSQTRYGFPRHISMVSPFRHSLVGYWPSLALVKSSSAFVKREVARLLQFHSHERSYSRPTAKTCPIYCHMLPKNCATTLLDTRSPLPKYLADLKLSLCKLQKDIIQSNPSSELADLIKWCCLSIQIVHPLPMFSSPTSSSIYDANNRVVTYLTACCGGLSWPIVTAGDGIANNTLSWKRNPSISRWKHVKNAFVGSVFARYLVSRSWICGLSLWHCVLYKATMSPASTQSLPAVPSSLLRRAVKKHVSPVWRSNIINSISLKLKDSMAKNSLNNKVRIEETTLDFFTNLIHWYK